MPKYQVRWKGSRDASEQVTDYPHYALAEGCFISLFAEVDRRGGGWAEVWEEGRLLLRLGGDDGYDHSTEEPEEAHLEIGAEVRDRVH
jgi:hypothetical protein